MCARAYCTCTLLATRRCVCVVVWANSPALRRLSRRATAALWLVIVVVWLSVLGPAKVGSVLEDNFEAPLIMVVGAFVAGCVAAMGAQWLPTEARALYPLHAAWPPADARSLA